MPPPPIPYPPTPQGVDEKIIQPSAAFKREVGKVMGAILVFFLVYVLLVLLAAAFAAVCGWSGWLLVSLKPSFITLMLGVGLAGLGVMVLFFLLKFLFKRTKTDLSGLVEVRETEQPELFSFIRRLAEETKAPFPKRIYLSPEVNACVFYASGFWSMFLPVRKNLQIGLGLVNTVDLTEFKAVLAHEFGHFSQRSMKLGSYVYNVNKVIYNLLFENDGYKHALARWAEASGYFALFASITAGVVQVMQWVLQQVYPLINKTYLGLSRQMEFHADSVAASVAGSAPLVSSLHRIEVADHNYQRLIDLYNGWLRHNLRPDNLYLHHRELMLHFAHTYRIPVDHGLPQIKDRSLACFYQSRLVVKDQWASHPSTEDRERHLLALNIPSEPRHESAWVLFRNPEQVQRQMTAKLFENVTFEQAPTLLDEEGFRQRHRQEEEENSFPPTYKGYYDNRPISEFNLRQETIVLPVSEDGPLEKLLDGSVCNLPSRIDSLQRDLSLLESINSGETQVKTFDFDGQKYSRKEAGHLIGPLQGELEQAQQKLEQQDIRLFQYFYQKAMAQGKAEELVQGYGRMFEAGKQTEEDLKIYNELREELNPIFTSELQLDQVKRILGNVKWKEILLRKRLQAMLQDEASMACIETGQQARLKEFLAHEREYFADQTFDNEALELLQEVLGLLVAISFTCAFRIKKVLLEQQLRLLEQEPEVAVKAE